MSDSQQRCSVCGSMKLELIGNGLHQVLSCMDCKRRRAVVDKDRVEIDLDKLERLAEAATRGPWVCIDGVRIHIGSTGKELCLGRVGETIAVTYDLGDGEANAKYIAALSPDVVLKLIEMARITNNILASIRSILDEAEDSSPMPDWYWDFGELNSHGRLSEMARKLWEIMRTGGDEGQRMRP